MRKLLLPVLLLINISLFSQNNNSVKENYDKIQAQITMRDGIKLHTLIFVPKDASENNKYPFLMERTPYSVGAYGENEYYKRLSSNANLEKEKYIFVFQDVRGRYMSEGVNLEVTPHLANKKSNKDVDESSDTYDTIEWLLKNIKHNNGRVGIYGISYPGFYATASLPGAHPALKAVSPQAPVTDEFMGDDANHNGAFFLLDNFSFMRSFGKPRTGPVLKYETTLFNVKYTNAYDFFLKLGPLSNTQSEKYFNHKSYIWNEYLQHDTYDEYWKSRNIRQHLKNIAIPVLVVGGWYDGEDLFGALNTYRTIEQQSKNNNCKLVMGPWTHGAWAANSWTKYGINDFGKNVNTFYKDSIEASFFNYYLKDKGNPDIAEATIFETGTNSWKHYKHWPLLNCNYVPYYLATKKELTTTAPVNKTFEEYISDPAKPVPYTNGIWAGRNGEYMTEDQRFAATRTDVLVYETSPLQNNIILSGPITADLDVSISGTDADFIVKLIDVMPDDTANITGAPRGFQLAGYQQLIRAEVMRGKFRNSFEKPEAFVPDKITKVKFTLNDVAHCFKKGHKIMVQVQSSWFPLVDRNPQTFVRIPDAKESDFKKATIKIFNSSKIILPVVKE